MSTKTIITTACAKKFVNKVLGMYNATVPTKNKLTQAAMIMRVDDCSPVYRYTIVAGTRPFVSDRCGVLQCRDSDNNYISYGKELLSYHDRCWGGCCGFRLIGGYGVSFEASSKITDEAAIVFGKFVRDCYGKYSHNYSLVFHAVSEQERVGQKEQLLKAGFVPWGEDIISQGTSHKLTLLAMDVRTTAGKKESESNYAMYSDPNRE